VFSEYTHINTTQGASVEIKITTKYLLEEKDKLSEEITKLLEKYARLSKNIDDLNHLKSQLK